MTSSAPRSHANELLAAPKQRLACDRCHAQKLRCFKGSGDDRCLRCVKRSAKCIFSVRTSRRLPTATPSPGYEAHSSRLDGPYSSNRASSPYSGMLPLPYPEEGRDLQAPLPLDFEMESLDGLDPVFFQTVGNSAGNSAASSTSSSTGVMPDQTPTAFHGSSERGQSSTVAPAEPISMADAVRVLSDLNVQLYEHAAALPPFPEEEIMYNISDGTTANNSRETSQVDEDYARAFDVERTFILTRSLIDVLRRLYQHIDDDLFARPLDRATVLLILSCYYRLMDVYEAIFGHMRTCTRNLPDCKHEDNHSIRAGVVVKGVVMPAFQFGAYKVPPLTYEADGGPPSNTTVSMYMMLILTMTSQVCDELQHVVGAGINRTRGAGGNTQNASEQHLHRSVDEILGSSPPYAFDGKARLAMCDRSRSISEQIHSLGQSLMRFSLNSL